MTIQADAVFSTDERFTMDNLSLGDGYRPLDVYFKSADGELIRRAYNKGERRNSNMTLARLACQIYETQLAGLSVGEKESFPICRYKADGELICGIYPSVDEYRKHRNTLEYCTYVYDHGRQFVFYCWNVFSTIIFVQECLKRFGAPGDRFILIYREKGEKEAETVEMEVQNMTQETLGQQSNGYRNPYSAMLIESKNIILRGAPGTGKSYLAKEIAADIISDGDFADYTMLTAEQRRQVEFVQFHPSYDYTDFVEGLRPRINEDGSLGFELQDGVFKRFVARARKNYEDSLRPREEIEREVSEQHRMEDYLGDLDLDNKGENALVTLNGNKFYITGYDERHIFVYIPDNATVRRLSVSRDSILKMLESGREFNKIKDITEFFGKRHATQEYSYVLPIYKAIKKKERRGSASGTGPVGLKKYIFIIDEINRGEISKIFGELFFAVDPGYRGRAGEVSTQYANLHDDPDEKFYIPENVYIIGTMNDIDRSVDSFDFAMRRRFRFIELRADDHLEMLAALGDEDLKAEAIRRMRALNREIAGVDELNANYQIGAA